MIKTLLLENYRGFKNLRLADLGRVNLIVGPNSTGKTSLLEAVSIASSWQTAMALPMTFRSNRGMETNNLLRWLVRDGCAESGATLTARDENTPSSTWTVELRLKQSDSEPTYPPGHAGRLAIEGGYIDRIHKDMQLKVGAVSILHKSPDELVEAFTKVVRSPEQEKFLEQLLQIIDPRLKSARLDYAQQNRNPLIVVDLGLSERVPLSQAGQGISRIIDIFSELLGRRPNICLIDEVENGLYYLTLPRVWKAIATVAEKLDIQIFATTHSNECVQAAHEAFANQPSYDLRLIQLYPMPDGTEGRVLDKNIIETGVSSDIDLR